MYTIKQAAARAGVSVALLRAWERRYGVVHPGRTPSGYRLYDDAAIGRLQAMRRLIDDGWGASAAAASIRDMGDEAVRALLSELAPAGGLAPTPRADELPARFVAAAATLDQVAMEAALDDAFARGSFEQVADALLLPMMVAIGDAWQAGDIDVASEHAASQAMLRRLAAAFEAAGRPLPGERAVLVGLPPGARHELGALAFAVAARRASLPVMYLGPDLPTANWVEAARAGAARAVVIGIVSPSDVKPAAQVAAALRDTQPDLVIAVGGRAAKSVPTAGVLQLPAALVAAVDLLRGALA